MQLALTICILSLNHNECIEAAHSNLYSKYDDQYLELFGNCKSMTSKSLIRVTPYKQIQNEVEFAYIGQEMITSLWIGKVRPFLLGSLYSCLIVQIDYSSPKVALRPTMNCAFSSGDSFVSGLGRV